MKARRFSQTLISSINDTEFSLKNQTLTMSLFCYGKPKGLFCLPFSAENRLSCNIELDIYSVKFTMILTSF